MRITSSIEASARVLGVACLLLTGCLPYTVGSTARPASPGELRQTGTLYAIPGAFEREYDSVSVPMRGADIEVRYGLDDYSDIGLRIPSLSGAVVNYKRRLDGASEDPGAAFAVMAGAGFVNFGEHALGELTLLASGDDARTLVPYGGIRGMQVIPLSRYAVSDRPTLGGFLGIRIGSADFGISPEIGVYYDPSALELRERRWIIVPAVSIHGEDLLNALGVALGW